MEYEVLGTAEVLVAVRVNAKTPEAALKKARKNFKGIESYLGNGGDDKLIGVEDDAESIYADDSQVTFNFVRDPITNDGWDF